jgi:hypothetical protein
MPAQTCIIFAPERAPLQLEASCARNNCLPWRLAPADGRCNLPLPNLELYRLDWDPEECFDVADTYPEVVSAIMSRIEAMIPPFPAQATSDWDSTRSTKVLSTAAGALPILAWLFVPILDTRPGR